MWPALWKFYVMDKIVIVGGGGHAKVLIGLMKKLPLFEIIGYTDVIDRGEILGVSYLGDDAVLASMQQTLGGLSAAIGVGTVSANAQRKDLMTKIAGYGYRFPAIVSPQAIVNEDVSMGDGTVVFDGVVVNPGTVIGRGVILNTNSTIEHDCRIGDYVHVAPGATLSGGVQVENASFIGAGSTIVQYKRICPSCVIGAGAVVVDHILQPGTYVGTPARRRP